MSVRSIQKVVTGGQTGADRAALDLALAKGIETGGYVPKGRLAEDGAISEHYIGLIETEKSEYDHRTRLNVLDSDATLIFCNGKLSGGTLLTFQIASENDKPTLVANFTDHIGQNTKSVKAWLRSISPSVLNIAGPRHSEDPEIYRLVYAFLEELWEKG